jgi:hypothetical protein
MTDEELVNTSIDEYLISLANSVNHAQRYIAQLRVSGSDGQPTITYQLPRVDFELKMQFQVVRTPPPSRAVQRDIAKAEGGGFLEARPLALQSNDEDATKAQVASTIKGSFLAVPVHGGAPAPLIEITWSPELGGTQATRQGDTVVAVYRIALTARTAGSGDPLRGRAVQFNIDRDLYSALAGLGGDARPNKGTRLERGVELTDQDGLAENKLTLAEPAGRYVPVVIDAFGQTETLVFRMPDSGPAASNDVAAGGV